MLPWKKRFNFFDREPLPDLPVEVTCSTAARGLVVVGDTLGNIHLAHDSDLKFVRHHAYRRGVTHAHLLKRHPILVTVGDGHDPRPADAQEEIHRAARMAAEKASRGREAVAGAGSSAAATGGGPPAAADDGDDGGDMRPPEWASLPATATVKVWRLDRREGAPPECIRTFRVLDLKPDVADNSVVTTLAVTEELSQIAVGMSDGALHLFRGEFHRDRGSVRRDALLSSGDAITFLGFAERKRAQDAAPATGLSSLASRAFTRRTVTTSLYVVTRNQALSLFTAGAKPPGVPPSGKVTLSVTGCEPGCAVVSDDDRQQLVLGTTDGVYFFTPTDRGNCCPFTGEKQLLAWFRSYLLVASLDSGHQRRTTLSVYDLENKFIAFSLTLSPSAGRRGRGAAAGSTRVGGDTGRPQHVDQLFCEFGAVYVITSGLQVHKLLEKDTSTKLERLFAINYYDIAIALARSAGYDDANITDIYRRSGDFEYGKKDYDKAIEQYISTIGHVEPSYVIRQFLDAQRIHNLTSYLEALHKQLVANSDHTTLLLNCYTKLKEDEKLRRFIRADDSTDLLFQVDTAISVLRGAGYLEDALYLAEKHQKHDWYLKIQVEDRSAFHAALKYVRRLPFLEAEKHLQRYGRMLVTNMPDEDFIPLYVDQPRHLKAFLQHVVSVGAHGDNDLAASPLIWNTLLELSLREEIARTELELAGSLGAKEGLAGAAAGTSSAAGTPAAGAPSATPKTMDPVSGALAAALVERKRDEEILHGILQNPAANYDVDHALVLVQMHGYRAGQLCLFEKLHMYPMVVQHYLELAAAHTAARRFSDARAARRTVVSKCKAFGDKDPNLWVQVLTAFAQNYTGSAEEESIKDVLAYIDAESLLPPLLVVQIVSQNPAAPLSLVSDFIVKRLTVEAEVIADDAAAIRQYRAETERNRATTRSLKTEAQIFRSRKCELCPTDLDLPAVHFMCKHSFHQHCLPDNEEECPTCAPHYRHVRDIQDSLNDKSSQHEQFFQELKAAPDGFTKVAEFFGKGALSGGGEAGIRVVHLEVGDDGEGDLHSD